MDWCACTCVVYARIYTCREIQECAACMCVHVTNLGEIHTVCMHANTVEEVLPCMQTDLQTAHIPVLFCCCCTWNSINGCTWGLPSAYEYVRIHTHTNKYTMQKHIRKTYTRSLFLVMMKYAGRLVWAHEHITHTYSKTFSRWWTAQAWLFGNTQRYYFCDAREKKSTR